MSTVSSIVPKLAGCNKNTTYKYLIGAFGLGSAGLGLYFNASARQEQIYLEKAKHKLNKQEEPTSIWGPSAVHYPWSANPNKNYEFDIVKMRGYFKEERFFVQKTKDGKIGFAVFAPFVTSHDNTETHPYMLPSINPSGIMVNLGWVPVENRFEIALDNEPLGKIDMEEVEFFGREEYKDECTGFSYKQVYDEEREEAYPFVDITGIVRRSETMNPFIGNTNMPTQAVFQYIDAYYMKMMFGFKNDVDFDDHYIERMVDDLEDADTYPIPATRNNFLTSNGTPDLYSRYARNSGIVSAASFLALAGLLLR